MRDIDQLARLDRAERERIVDEAVRSMLALVRDALSGAPDRSITSPADAADRLLELPVVSAADLLDPMDPRCSDGVTMTWPVSGTKVLAVRLLPSLEGTVLPDALGCLAGAVRTGAAEAGRPEFGLSRSEVVELLHKLSAPLTSVMAYTTLLADTATGPLNEEQRQFVAVLERNSARLMEMINDFNAALPWEPTSSRQEDQ